MGNDGSREGDGSTEGLKVQGFGVLGFKASDRKLLVG